MRRQRRWLRPFVSAGEHITNLLAVLLILILLGYSAYSVWYTYSLKNGSFLSDELAMYKPDGEEPTLEELMKINPDVKAWLTIDDTHIDYPVVQGEDNWEYLNKDVEQAFSLAGAIFLDSTNKSDFTNPYNMVYGHHIEGGAMFSDVLEFRKASFFDTHKTGILWLADKAYHIDLFACVEVDASDKVIYQEPHLVRAGSLPEVAGYITSHATHVRHTEITEKDSVIGLSTCEEADNFDRVLIFGKMRPMTQAEMQAAMQRNREMKTDREERSNPWLEWLLKHPIPIFTGGAFLLLLVVWLLTRKRRNR